MPKWFQGIACAEVCHSNLRCPPEALGSACGLLSNDRLPFGGENLDSSKVKLFASDLQAKYIHLQAFGIFLQAICKPFGAIPLYFRLKN